MIMTRLRTCLRFPLARCSPRPPSPSRPRRPSTASPTPSRRRPTSPSSAGCSSTGTRGRRCRARSCSWRGTASSPSAAGDELTVPDGAEVVDARGMTILPGLIDAHVHLDILGHSDYQHWHGRYRDGPLRRDHGRLDPAAPPERRHHGGRSGRAAGCPRPEIKARIDSGDLPGPRIVASMGWITNWTDEQVARHHRRSHTVNVRTVDEARTAARSAIAQGAGIIKVHTGLTEAQLRAIREEADAAGIRITGHVGHARRPAHADPGGPGRHRAPVARGRASALASRPRCSRAWWTTAPGSSPP